MNFFCIFLKSFVITVQVSAPLYLVLIQGAAEIPPIYLCVTYVVQVNFGKW